MTRSVPTRPVGAGQARGDRTRALIIDETIRCVLEKGFAAASAKHIAERAGVTWGVIQYHFGDRDSLLIAVVETGYDGLEQAIASVSLPAGEVRERVQTLVDATWAAFSTPASMAALEILVATRSDRDPAVDVRLVGLARRLRRLGRSLAAGSDHPDPAALGDLLWASLRGLVLAQMVVREPVDSTRERAVLVDVLVHALSAEPLP